MQGTGQLSVDMSDQASARKFGEWLGASFSGSCLGIYTGEEGPSALSDDEKTAPVRERDHLVSALVIINAELSRVLKPHASGKAQPFKRLRPTRPAARK